MKTIRIGNDINVTWKVLSRNGMPYSLEEKILGLWLVSGPFRKEISTYQVRNINKIEFSIDAEELKRYGVYKLIFRVKDSEAVADDAAYELAQVFQIVSKSYPGITDVGIGGAVDIEFESILNDVIVSTLRGESAYDIAVRHGYTGTEEEWLAGLKGDQGVSVESVEQTVVSELSGGVNKATVTLSNGDQSELEFRNGEKGDQGIQGETGPQGIQGAAGLTGPKGDKGDKGDSGVSLGEVALTTSINETATGKALDASAMQTFLHFLPGEESEEIEEVPSNYYNRQQVDVLLNDKQTQINNQNQKIEDFKAAVKDMVENYPNVTYEGDVTNMPDEEDLTTDSSNHLKLANRPAIDGMGYIILRKNKTFAEQVTLPNTIYEIRYEFDLGGESVTIPEGCVLKFEGGKLSNGVLVGQNTAIIAPIKEIMSDIILSQEGTWTNKNGFPEWFGDVANPDFDSKLAIQNAVLSAQTCILSQRYYTNWDTIVHDSQAFSIRIPNGKSIIGSGDSEIIVDAKRENTERGSIFRCYGGNSISGVKITYVNYDMSGWTGTQSGVFRIEGGSDVAIKDCRVERAMGAFINCLLTSESKNFSFCNNRVLDCDCGFIFQAFDSESFTSSGTYPLNLLIDGNVIEKQYLVKSEMVSFWVRSPGIILYFSDIRISNNIFKNGIGGACIQTNNLNGIKKAKILNNSFFDCGANSFYISSDVDYFNNKVYDSTILTRLGESAGGSRMDLSFNNCKRISIDESSCLSLVLVDCIDIEVGSLTLTANATEEELVNYANYITNFVRLNITRSSVQIDNLRIKPSLEEGAYIAGYNSLCVFTDSNVIINTLFSDLVIQITNNRSRLLFKDTYHAPVLGAKYQKGDYYNNGNKSRSEVTDNFYGTIAGDIYKDGDNNLFLVNDTRNGKQTVRIVLTLAAEVNAGTITVTVNENKYNVPLNSFAISTLERLAYAIRRNLLDHCEYLTYTNRSVNTTSGTVTVDIVFPFAVDSSSLSFNGGSTGITGTVTLQSEHNGTAASTLSLIKIGATSARPATASVGAQYFDTTINKPVWYKGNSVWVDATGATV